MKIFYLVICASIITCLSNAQKMMVNLVNGDTINYFIDDIIDLTFTQDISQDYIYQFGFLKSDNGKNVYKDVYATIDNDEITLVTPYIKDLSNIVPAFRTPIGAKVFVNDVEQISGKTAVNFSSPVVFVVESQSGETREYIVNIQITGLPLLVINTEDDKPIISKDEYIPASFRIIDNNRVDNDVNTHNLNLCIGKIKGRGNSTWQMPKKPYKIKFESKQSLFGEAEDKEWVLLANYSDKTMLRNAISFWIGKEISNLDYTSSFHFVDLELNNNYMGTYVVAEQQKIAKHRVNVGDDGFLLEVDAKAHADDPTFKTKKLNNPINIKDPNVEKDDDNFVFIKDYILEAENVLYSSNYTDLEFGYYNYFDLESFADWYLVNELSKNNDAVFYTSCYFYKSRKGKIYMGPLWDFDIAYGNIDYNDCWIVEGWQIKTAKTWIKQMFTDPVFVSLIKERMAYFYAKKNDILDKITELADYLQYAQKANENVWHTMNVKVWPNYKVCGSYEAEVEYLKDWFSARIDWVNKNINDL